MASVYLRALLCGTSDDWPVLSYMESDPKSSEHPVDCTMSLATRAAGGMTSASPGAIVENLTRWIVTSPSGSNNTSGTLAELGITSDGNRATPAAGFHLIEQIGRGGMGEVWEARQASLGRTVAVKRIRQDRLSNEDRSVLTVEFVREAIITATLEHPNIVPVHDLGADADGLPLLAMKLVKGRPWDALLKEDFLKLSAPALLGKNLPILVAMAQAVAFAHARGIVHRDLKPGQVMVGEFGETILMDWGLAIFVGASDSAESGAFAQDAGAAPFRPPSIAEALNPAGTPALMAPEQTESEPNRLGVRTDVYLLGATLYFLLTGTYPHRGATSADVMRRARRGGSILPRCGRRAARFRSSWSNSR
jgi:serine/threonine protein kinase